MKLDPFREKIRSNPLLFKDIVDKNEIRDEFEGKGAKIAEKR